MHAKQDIMIQNISLPQNIADQMSAKTMVKSKQQYEVMEQTFEMQSIRLRNEMDKVSTYHPGFHLLLCWK